MISGVGGAGPLYPSYGRVGDSQGAQVATDAYNIKDSIQALYSATYPSGPDEPTPPNQGDQSKCVKAAVDAFSKLKEDVTNFNCGSYQIDDKGTTINDVISQLQGEFDTIQSKNSQDSQQMYQAFLHSGIEDAAANLWKKLAGGGG